MEKEDNQSDSNSQKTRTEDSDINQAKISTDDSLLKKKTKKRERSPTIHINEHSLMLRNSSNSQSNSNIEKLNANNASTSSTLAPNVQNSNQPVKKEKQKPESWNKIEQQIFFNALRQNGKNFESITQCFNARQKKYKIDDGISVQRSKEQIRHFYYRTWHKIIKYISLPMLNQENQANCDTNGTNSNYINGKIAINVSDCSLRDMQVKCLIAYNALMNKSYRWNKKTAIKLVELINHGWTTVREKGKITRLRMPICKLSGKPQPTDIESASNTNNANTIPDILSIYLEPNSESSYCRIHKLAQNPFVNVEVNSNQTIKFLIEYLENKWKNRRNQFIEKFQIENQARISKTNYQEPQNSMTDSDDNEILNKPIKKNLINDFNNRMYFSENLIIYPNECHQFVSIDLITDNTQKSTQQDEPKHSQIDSSPVNSSFNDGHIISDDPMGIDDCAVNPDNFVPSKKTNIDKIESLNKKSDFLLNPEQIKAGLTSRNSFLVLNGKDKKDLTFSQLYLALNRPKSLKFKYDWVIEKETSDSNTNVNSMSNIQQSSSSSSSSIQTLMNKQNIQQRFYIDTLASVAASFLKEILKNKQENSQMNSKINQQQIVTQESKQSSNNVFKSPPNPSDLPSASIAVIQPNTSIKQTIAFPIENVLQSLNEQQANRTKKLLSDLPKRRSRQRKPIMVVNSSHSQRPMLPKLNFNTQQMISLNNELDSPGQQNIVYSGPMAAIARQIVNNAGLKNDLNKQQAQRLVQDDQNQSSQSPKILTSSLQQTYSNIIPRILNNLMDPNEQNDGSDEINSDNNINDKNLEEIGSPQNLTSMSLLELSINNADSLFGSSVVRLNQDNNKSSKIINESESSSKSNDTIQINLNDVSNITSILNSIVPQQSSQSDNRTVNLVRVNSHMNNMLSNGNQGTSYSLTHRKSDIMVEWTDSMNDVSLSGCFITDFQSPDKQAKKPIVNEVSRDSIFFNMDTIMDIMPDGASRYDDSSLLNSSMNTIDHIVSKNFSK